MDLVKLSRRALALLLALLALWLLWVNGSGSADATTQRLFTPPGSEGAASAGNELGLWERLIVRQSPYLKAGQVLMGSGTAAAENTPYPEKDENTDGELYGRPRTAVTPLGIVPTLMRNPRPPPFPKHNMSSPRPYCRPPTVLTPAWAGCSSTTAPVRRWTWRRWHRRRSP